MASDNGYLEGCKTLRAKNLEEARRILFERYQKNYTIRLKRSVPKHGFSGLFGKEELEILYTIDKPSVYSDSYNPYGNPMNVSLSQELASQSAGLTSSDFEKNKNELLKKAGKNVVASISSAQLDSQFSDVKKDLDELKQLIAEKASAQNSGQLHPNITKIQELLSQNEFSYSYIQMITEKIKKTLSGGTVICFFAFFHICFRAIFVT